MPPTDPAELTVPSCLLALLALFLVSILLFSGWYILVKIGSNWLFLIYAASLGLLAISLTTVVQAVRGSLCFARRRPPAAVYWLFVIVCFLIGLLLLGFSLREVWQAIGVSWGTMGLVHGSSAL